MTTITGVIARTGLRLLREEHYLAALGSTPAFPRATRG